MCTAAPEASAALPQGGPAAQLLPKGHRSVFSFALLVCYEQVYENGRKLDSGWGALSGVHRDRLSPSAPENYTVSLNHVAPIHLMTRITF